MDAFERLARANETQLPHAALRLAWLTPPPPRIGMCVRDADGARLGAVCDVIVGESGGVVAVGLACSDRRLGQRRLQAAALRAYGDGLVCLYFRRDLPALPVAGPAPREAPASV